MSGRAIEEEMVCGLVFFLPILSMMREQATEREGVCVMHVVDCI